MLQPSTQFDPSVTSLHYGLTLIAAEYGTLGIVGDSFTVICGENNAACCQRAIDAPELRMYRLSLIVVPNEMLSGPDTWCVARRGREGVWTTGAV